MHEILFEIILTVSYCEPVRLKACCASTKAFFSSSLDVRAKPLSAYWPRTVRSFCESYILSVVK